MSVRDIKSVKREPVADVVAALRDVLGDAERGDVIAVTIAAERPSGEVMIVRTRSATVATHLYALEYAKKRLLDDD